jgi:hypothetical protein
VAFLDLALMDNFYMYAYALPVWNLGTFTPSLDILKSRLISSGRIKVDNFRYQKPLGSELWSQYLMDDRLDDHSLYHCYFPTT